MGILTPRYGTSGLRAESAVTASRSPMLLESWTMVTLQSSAKETPSSKLVLAQFSMKELEGTASTVTTKVIVPLAPAASVSVSHHWILVTSSAAG